MVVRLEEYDGCFSVSFAPETMEEQALVVRMGMNATKEVKSVSVYVCKDLSVSGYLVVGKRKKAKVTV